MIHRPVKGLIFEECEHTPFECAILMGALDRVAQLLNAGLDRGDDHKAHALMLATMLSSPAMVQLLIDAGADVNKFLENGDTPLTSAVRTCTLEMVQLLIDAGADVNKTSRRDGNTPLGGRSPLTSAVILDKPEMCKLLIDAGADVNKSDENFCTPLTSAVRTCTPEIAQLLIDAGADVEKKDMCGITPLEFTRFEHSRQREMLKILSKKQSFKKQALSVFQGLPRVFSGSKAVA
jgi:ankyrin repeat protein